MLRHHFYHPRVTTCMKWKKLYVTRVTSGRSWPSATSARQLDLVHGAMVEDTRISLYSCAAVRDISEFSRTIARKKEARVALTTLASLPPRDEAS
jgi:hypothetical protein